MALLLLLLQLTNSADTERLSEDGALDFFDFVSVQIRNLTPSDIDKYYRQRQGDPNDYGHRLQTFNCHRFGSGEDMEFHFLPDMKDKYLDVTCKKFQERCGTINRSLLLRIEHFLGDEDSVENVLARMRQANKFTFQPTKKVSNRYDMLVKAFKDKFAGAAARELCKRLIDKHDEYYKGVPKDYSHSIIHAKRKEYSNEAVRHTKRLLQDYFRGYDVELKCIDVQHSTAPEMKIDLSISTKQSVSIGSLHVRIRKLWKEIRQLPLKIQKTIFLLVLAQLLTSGLTMKKMNLSKRQLMIYSVGNLIHILTVLCANKVTSFFEDDGVVFVA